jgi:hypothetical protein
VDAVYITAFGDYYLLQNTNLFRICSEKASQEILEGILAELEDPRRENAEVEEKEKLNSGCH